MGTHVAVVDYGVGNIGSVINMLRRLGADTSLAATPEEVSCARALILPGVGAFDNGIRSLRERALEEPLRERVMNQGVPILGICLGMQLLTRSSEEGTEHGLAWLDAQTIRIPDHGLPVPHMGWNETKCYDSELFTDLKAPETRFYYVHSYHVVCNKTEDVSAEVHYGVDLVAAFHHENIFGTQFHPEKSHRFGMQVLQNFLRCAERV